MAMRCPRCRAIAKTRTSVELSLLVRRSYHQCQNMLWVLFHQHDGNRRFTKPDPASARRDGATRSFSTKSPRRRSAIAGIIKAAPKWGRYLFHVYGYKP